MQEGARAIQDNSEVEVGGKSSSVINGSWDPKQNTCKPFLPNIEESWIGLPWSWML